MDSKETCGDWAVCAAPCETEIRKGRWTMEEDLQLLDCLAIHGAGHWNYLAHCAGLKRTGKSCRLRWLNYLHPDVKHGNLTLQEQILILELHSRWGNRWSNIAQYLPGRTDNEVKNYWRTRVKKLAKQLKCDLNSIQFRETMRNFWLPALSDRVEGPLSAQFSMSTSHPTGPSRDRTADTVMAMAAGTYVVPNGLIIGMDDLKHTTNSEISCASSAEIQVSPASALPCCGPDVFGFDWSEGFEHQSAIIGLNCTAFPNFGC